MIDTATVKREKIQKHVGVEMLPRSSSHLAPGGKPLDQHIGRGGDETLQSHGLLGQPFSGEGLTSDLWQIDDAYVVSRIALEAAYQPEDFQRSLLRVQQSLHVINFFSSCY